MSPTCSPTPMACAKAIGSFLDRFWRRARSDGRIVYVREVDDMIRAVFRPREAAWRNPQVEPLAMLNVDCRGNVSTFSPRAARHEACRLRRFPDRQRRYRQFRADARQSGPRGRCSATLPRASPPARWNAAISRSAAAVRRSTSWPRTPASPAPGRCSCALTQMAPADVVLGSVENLLASRL